MHRLIVTSATYRQSSRVTPEHRARDPREPAVFAGEPVSDAVAAPARLGARAAGLLDPRIGGRPVYPYQPDAIWEAWPSPRSATSPTRPRRARTSIAAASTRSGGGPSARPTCSTPRTGRPAACGPPHQHAAACAHHAQRPHLGRGRAGAGRAEHEDPPTMSTTG